MSEWIKRCGLCPRRCGADRTKRPGLCGAGAELRAARAALHFWEEPPISGTRGSGAIFFSGCPLRCVFCQNKRISAENFGAPLTVSRLAEIMLALRAEGAHNINLVSPTQYVPFIAEALDGVKDRLGIPVVYNTGGYELTDTLRTLDGLVDVYLPDLKYDSPELAEKYSSAPDYPERARAAILEMYRQTGPAVFEDGLIKRGVIIRHLVLPGCRRDSIAVLRRIKELFPGGGVPVSVMNQYTPPSVRPPGFPEGLSRSLTTFEYESVLKEAEALGLDGYRQWGGTVSESFIPDFDLTGIK